MRPRGSLLSSMGQISPGASRPASSEGREAAIPSGVPILRPSDGGRLPSEPDPAASSEVCFVASRAPQPSSPKCLSHPFPTPTPTTSCSLSRRSRGPCCSASRTCGTAAVCPYPTPLHCGAMWTRICLRMRCTISASIILSCAPCSEPAAKEARPTSFLPRWSHRTPSPDCSLLWWCVW